MLLGETSFRSPATEKACSKKNCDALASPGAQVRSIVALECYSSFVVSFHPRVIHCPYVLITCISSPPNLDEPIQPPIKLLAPDRHLHSIERVLHNEVGIQFIHLLYHSIHVGLLRLRHQQELGPRLCLEALQAEVTLLHDFDASRAVGKGRWRHHVVLRRDVGYARGRR